MALHYKMAKIASSYLFYLHFIIKTKLGNILFFMFFKGLHLGQLVVGEGRKLKGCLNESLQEIIVRSIDLLGGRLFNVRL